MVGNAEEVTYKAAAAVWIAHPIAGLFCMVQYGGIVSVDGGIVSVDGGIVSVDGGIVSVHICPQANKTLLVPTPRLRTGLFNKITPPEDANKEILRKCSTALVCPPGMFTGID